MIPNAESMRFLFGICETRHQRREGGESRAVGQRSGAEPQGRLLRSPFRAWHQHVMRAWCLVMGTNYSSWGLWCHFAANGQRTICHLLWKKALTSYHSKALNISCSAVSPQPSPENKDFLLLVLGPLAMRRVGAQEHTCSFVPWGSWACWAGQRLGQWRQRYPLCSLRRGWFIMECCCLLFSKTSVREQSCCLKRE